MFIIQHHVHKSSPADLLSCADQHWLTLLMSQLHFSAPSPASCACKPKLIWDTCSGNVSFHYQAANRWRQTRNAGCCTERGGKMGTVSGQSFCPGSQCGTQWVSGGGRFLPDLLHYHIFGQNAATNNQILLAVSLQLWVVLGTNRSCKLGYEMGDES